MLHLVRRLSFAALLVLLLATVTPAWAAEIVPVAYGTVGTTYQASFEDVAGGAGFGTNYDAILPSGTLSFAERLAGQTLSASGNFDVLSGSPVNPLGLQIGAPGRNLAVATVLGSNVLVGLGPLGYGDPDAAGEGAVAVLFPSDVSQVGFEVVGNNAGGNLFLSFFRRDGTLVEDVTQPITTSVSASFGFARVGDVADIAGVSIYNDDLSGLSFDNFRAAAVPEPSTLALTGLGMLGMVGWLRRRKRSA
jgi:PEP-CTERM motif